MTDVVQHTLPDMESAAEAVHNDWVDYMKSLGIHSKQDEYNQEMVIPYRQLPDHSKQRVRRGVDVVFRMITG